MAHDEAAAGLLDQLTDTHLADRARYGERVGFDELYRRHAGLVAAYATALTGHPDAAPELVTRAFPDALDAVVAGRSTFDDPFVPSLLRATRDLATIANLAGPPDAAGLVHHLPPHADLVAVTYLFHHLTEAQRAAIFCTVVVGLDSTDLAQALDVPPIEAERLLADGRAALGGHLSGAVDVLRDLTVPVDPDTDLEALGSWRSWAQAEPTVAATHDRGALIVRLEPVATKVLRGAAAVVLLAGAAGMVLNSRASAGSDVARAAASRHQPTLGIDDGAPSRIDLAAHHVATGEDPPAAGSVGPLGVAGLPGLSGGTAARGIGGSTSASGKSNTTSGGSGQGTPTAGDTSGGAAGAPSPGGSTGPDDGGPTPAAPPTTAPAGGGSGGGGTGAPVTAPPATTPPTTAPPATTPPTTAPKNPLAPVVTTVTGIVTTIVNPITGLPLKH